MYKALARPSGAFNMLAIDARESMRKIIRDAGLPHTDGELSDFKRLVAEQVGGEASAVLCDLQYGERAIETLRRCYPGTGLVLAVDRYEEEFLGSLIESRFDEKAAERALSVEGVIALKLYVFWRRESREHFLEPATRRFIEHCRSSGVLSLVEGVITTDAASPNFDTDLVAAAADFGRLQPDLYKTQLPSLGRQNSDEIERVARELTDAVGVPWVVLSKGAKPHLFASSVEAVCRGGASGILAGRAIWSGALSEDDAEEELKTHGRGRLQDLGRIVDRWAHPWSARPRRDS